jgi:hypothetical protein
MTRPRRSKFLLNRRQIKKQIIKKYGSVKVFSDHAGIRYNYIANTLSGHQFYAQACETLKQNGYPVKVVEKYKKAVGR